MEQIKKVFLAILLFALIASLGCNKSTKQNDNNSKGKTYNKKVSEITDKYGNKYKTTTIGTQIWMAENLNIEHYRNGDSIPQVLDKDKWAELKSGAWCYYFHDSINGKIFGKLYNWYAVNDPRGLAPEGWHIPSDIEWTQLTDYLGGESVAGGKMKDTIFWKSPNTAATDESGFKSLPGGARLFLGSFNFGCIDSIGEYGCFWSSTKDYDHFAWYRNLYYSNSIVVRSNLWMEDGLSVRCVKD